MSEFELLFKDAAFVFNFIFSLILLIVFFRLAWNVGRLRKHVVSPTTSSMKDLAERFEFKGQNEKAIDCYLDALYNTLKKSYDEEEKKLKDVKSIIEKIGMLGGMIPPSAEKLIKEL